MKPSIMQASYFIARHLYRGQMNLSAEKAGTHRTYVSSIELGKISLGIEVANQLAVALGKRLSELVEVAE